VRFSPSAPASLYSQLLRRASRASPNRGRSGPDWRRCSLAILALAPNERLLDLAGWIWPALLALLVASSFRGTRRSLHKWSRRALVYPALSVLLLIGSAV
jgi:hypothetical protein